MKEENTSLRLRKLMNERNLRQVDILNLTKPFCEQYSVKMNKSDISQYVSGKNEPSQDKLVVLGMALNVSEAWLMGYDVPMERESADNATSNIDNIFQIELKRFPLVGEIACGTPKFANEDRESYILAGTDIHADFCLKVKGDSMINARIHDGDIVFIQKQDIVENGEIAAVVVNGINEATLKRFYYYHEKAMLILKPENPAYEDQIYMGNELEQVHVLGKAIAFQSDVK